MPALILRIIIFVPLFMSLRILKFSRTFLYMIIALYILIYIAIFKQIPNSLSQTVYKLKYKYIWTIVISLTVFILGFQLFPIVKYSFIVFIGLASLLFVGGTPLVLDETQLSYKVHMISAYICAISVNILVLIENPLFLLCWIPWIIIYFIYNKNWKSKKFWAEIVCFLMIWLILLTE